MLSLHDLRAPAVALDWPEAVAVVAALIGSMIDAHADACPAPADVALLPSGDLRVSGPGSLAGAPAAAVAAVLGQLLDSAPCPAELRQIAGSFAADDRRGPAGQDALVAFMTALAFFERPGRQAVLAALAERAGSALERTRRLEALEALTERTRIAAGAPPRPSPFDSQAPEPPAPVDWETPAPESPWRLAMPAAAAIMVFVGMAYLAASWFGDRAAPPDDRAAEVEEELPISGPGGVPETAGPRRTAEDRPPAPTAASGASGAAATGRAATVGAATGPAASPATAPSPGGSTPAAAASSTPAPASLPAQPPGGGVSKRGGVDVAVSEREGRVLPSRIAPMRPTARPAPGGRVFTGSDPQVTPAVLIRPHLPEQPPPGVPEEQIGTLEFVVTESGAVEHVHLISPANRYQERMLVAAAKTWQFQPAMLDGHPVRFRIRIRVTL